MRTQSLGITPVKSGGLTAYTRADGADVTESEGRPLKRMSTPFLIRCLRLIQLELIQFGAQR